MQQFWSSIRRFLVNEDGPTSVEYLFMLMLVITAAVGGITILGNFAHSLFIATRDAMP
jgi:pilus assembly protein Flp/PilA